jgi:large subunit ribosomal protein L32e
MIFMDKKSLLAQRARQKRKKPTFCRKNWNAKGKIEKNVWRKARGCDNKQRIHKRGCSTKPSSGFRSPAEVRGLHSSGLIPVLVSNLKQVDQLTKENGVILSGKLGGKKKKEIILAIKAKGFEIINLEADNAVAKIDSALKQRQEERKNKAEQKLKSEKEKKSIDEKLRKESKKEEKKSADAAAANANVTADANADAKSNTPELSDEDKKKQEKEEKDKLLTHKM